MVDLEKMTVTLGSQTDPIDRFETWWAVPTFGIAVSLDAAKTIMTNNGMPFNVVRPLTVAICPSGLYEVMLC